MKLANTYAVITGGGGIVGKTIARFFIQEGCHVIVAGRSSESIESACNELSEDQKERFDAQVCEVSNQKSVQTLMEYVYKKYGHLDILVTAAGVYGEIGSVEQCDAEAWLEAIKINLWGTMLAVKFALPMLKNSPRGKIITFAGGGDGALPNFTSYASSKGAVLRFTESVASELKEFHIDVNAISPGLVASGITEDLVAAGPARVGEQKYNEALQELAGQKATVSPEKAAALAVWLASAESNGLTGKNISAVWDRYEDIPKHLAELQGSDVYNWRRIKPKDRGYDW